MVDTREATRVCSACGVVQPGIMMEDEIPRRISSVSDGSDAARDRYFVSRSEVRALVDKGIHMLERKGSHLDTAEKVYESVNRFANYVQEKLHAVPFLNISRGVLLSAYDVAALVCAVQEAARKIAAPREVDVIGQRKYFSGPAAACLFVGFKVNDCERLQSEVSAIFGVPLVSVEHALARIQAIMGDYNHPDFMKIATRSSPAVALPRIMNALCDTTKCRQTTARILRLLETPAYVRAARALSNRRTENVALAALVCTAGAFPVANVAAVVGVREATVRQAAKEVAQLVSP